MKKKTVLKTILSLTLATSLLWGCGNSTDATTTSENVPEKVAEPVETPDTEEKEEVTEPAEEEELKQEEATEEPAEEISTEMPEAQITTTVKNFGEFLNYVDSLDKQTPMLLIYNEDEGYVFNMGEGEYYQLKGNDRIFTYLTENHYASSDTLEAGPGVGIKGSLFEAIPDYSKYDSPHEVIYEVYYTEEFEKGNCFSITCYLDAPAE